MARAVSSRAAQFALERFVAAPKYEVVPLPGIIEQLPHIPAGATVAVTASPRRGLGATLQIGEQLQRAGFVVVAHIAARSVDGRAALRELLAGLRAAGIERAFVVGGDAETAGEFADGLALLRAFADAGHTFRELGIPCYPQGHPAIPPERLLADLEAKTPFADYMTTQLCFDAAALADWIRARRSAGNRLPVDIGVAGAAEIRRLLRISLSIGVRDARRFLAANTPLVGRFLRRGGYRPDSLLEALAPLLADPDAGVRQLHLYTFNDVRSTEAWRQRYLSSLRVARAD
jgi:methylenetetrahydrofolate reductase (NADPH)